MSALHHRAAEGLGVLLGTGARYVWDGSGAYWAQYRTWLWPGRWRTTLARYTGSVIAVVVIGSIAVAVPVLMWPLTAGWCLAAGLRQRRVERQAAAEAAFLAFLDANVGDRNGVHLAHLLALLHGSGMHTGWDVTEVRRQCARLGVRTRDVKVDGRVTVGVHRTDLDQVLTPPPPLPDTPSGDGSPQVSDTTTSPTAEARGEVSCTVQQPTVETIEDALESHIGDALALLHGEVSSR